MEEEEVPPIPLQLTMEDLLNQIRLMQGVIERQQASITHLEQQTIAPPLPPSAPKRPKEKLPTLDKYTGKRSEWDEWHLTAKNKLAVDGEAIGTNLDQFMYIFSRLGGDAAKTVSTKAQTLSDNRSGNGASFLAYLDTVYGDPNKRSRALQALYNMKQKNHESFAAFLPKFESTLANAGGSELPDEQKISLLKNALNDALRMQLVGLTGEATTVWTKYVSHLQTVSSDLASLQHSHKKAVLPTEVGTARDKDTMDWEPTRSSNTTAGSRKRAKWVSKETLDFRMQKNLCLRCGRPGHRAADCSFLPPIRPTTKVNNVNITKEDLAVAEAEKSEDEESQGKE